MGEMEIGLLKSGEEEELLSFYKQFHDRGEKLTAFYFWRREEKTVVGNGIDYVVRFRGRIVGAMGLNPVIHTYKGEKVVAHWHRDTLVSPEMRGKGLVKKLLKAASQEFEMVLAKGSNEIMYKVRKEFGWKDAPNCDNMALVLQCWPKGKDWKTKVSHFFLFIWGSIFSRVYSKKPISCHEIQRFNEDFDVISEKMLNSNEFGIYKTSSYLNWRYFNCPGKRYVVLGAGEKRVEGAVVIRLPRERFDEAWIIDLLCESKEKEIIRELVTGALEKIKESGAGKILVFATSSEVRKILARFGFVSIRRSPRFTFIIKPSHKLATVVGNLEWGFWHGDSDNELYE